MSAATQECRKADFPRTRPPFGRAGRRRRSAATALGAAVRALGADGFVYANACEDPGSRSWVVPDGSQASPAGPVERLDFDGALSELGEMAEARRAALAPSRPGCRARAHAVPGTGSGTRGTRGDPPGLRRGNLVRRTGRGGAERRRPRVRGDVPQSRSCGAVRAAGGRGVHAGGHGRPRHAPCRLGKRGAPDGFRGGLRHRPRAAPPGTGPRSAREPRGTPGRRCFPRTRGGRCTTPSAT